MTRFAVTLIFACVLAGAIFSAFSHREEKLEPDYSSPQQSYGTVALRDIERGSEISEESVEGQYVETVYHVPNQGLVIKRKAERTIRKGDLVRFEDAGWNRRIIIVTTKEIPKGKVLESSDVYETRFYSEGPPSQRQQHSSDVVGKKTVRRLGANEAVLPSPYMISPLPIPFIAAIEQ